MGMTTPFPEPDSPELGRFVVNARPQIVGLLRSVCDHDVPMNVFIGDGCEFDVSTLRSVDEAGGRLLFDAPADERVRQNLLAAPAATFVGYVDGDKVQFTAAACTDKHEGQPVLSVPLPGQLLHLQRRSAARFRPQVTRTAVCRIPLSGDADDYEELRVLDIGTGGLALQGDAIRLCLCIGTRFDGCRLDLPGVGGAALSLRVRHAGRLSGEPPQCTFGCEFVELAPAVRGMIGRYLARCEAGVAGQHGAGE